MSDTLDDSVARTHASELAALGHEARLAIYRTLVRAGDAGLAVHEVQERLGGMPRSTLAHHLQTLARSGLVVQRKVGAEVVNVAAFDAMHALVRYLTEACCVDACLVTGPAAQEVVFSTER